MRRHLLGMVFVNLVDYLFLSKRFAVSINECSLSSMKAQRDHLHVFEMAACSQTSDQAMVAQVRFESVLELQPRQIAGRQD